MNTSKSFQALRRANPRTKPGFSRSVEAAADAVRSQIVTTRMDAPGPEAARSYRRPVLVSISAASLAAAAVAVVSLMVGSSGGGAGVQDASAAVRKAATLTAASAERSGTAVVRVTRNSEVRGGSTIRWHNGDLAVSDDGPGPAKPGSAFLIVDGILYAGDPVDGGWVVLGQPEKIDSSSPTTTDDVAAVREDISGVTLRRIIDRITGLTTTRLKDGSTVYRGTLPAGPVARTDGKPARVLPFDYEAGDEAADPSAPLDVAITVGADGLVREDVVQWGTGGSVWTYAVTYSRLGKTSALPAPTNARTTKDASPASNSRTAPSTRK
jgi:hypothetical protein